MMYVHLPFYSCLVLRILFREMWLRTERNDPRCTLFYTYQPAALQNGCACVIVCLCVLV